MTDDGETIRLRDTRPCAVAAAHVLAGLDAEVYRACDAARSPGGVVDGVRRAGWTVTGSDVDAAVARLIDARVLARFGDRLLSLATGEPARPYRSFEDYPGGLACSPERQRRRDLMDFMDFDPGDVPLRRLFASGGPAAAAAGADGS